MVYESIYINYLPFLLKDFLDLLDFDLAVGVSFLALTDLLCKAFFFLATEYPKEPETEYRALQTGRGTEHQANHQQPAG